MNNHTLEIIRAAPGGGHMTLHSAHLADLEKSGLTADTIKAAGIYTVPPDEIGKKLGGGDGGIESLLAFPYPGCEGHERFRCWYQEGKSGPKYRQKKDSPNRLYLPPGTDLSGDSPLVLVEGEKKTLALWQAGFQVVGLGGVWNWCEKAEGYKKPKEKKPISDLDKVNWKRPVTVLFDSDGHDNRLVRLAAFRLARELSSRGAAVSILFIPTGTRGEKQGADDFLLAHGPEALRELLKAAWGFDPAWDDIRAEINWQTRELTPKSPLDDKLKALGSLVPTLARMTELDRAAAQEKLRERLALPAKFLSALTRDIQQAVKAKGKTQAKGGSNGREVYTALFDGLVDLVEHEGNPATSVSDYCAHPVKRLNLEAGR